MSFDVASGICRHRPLPRVIALALFVFSLLALGLVLDSRDGWATAPIPSIGGFTPAAGYPGVAVTVTGIGLSTVTGVAFNGTPAVCWNIDSDTQVTAVVPRGATSGPITLTGPGLTLDSADAFTAAPNGPGWIAYVNWDFTIFERNIWVMAPDGTRKQQLTSGQNKNDSPELSPDGTRIVFQSNRSGDWGVYIMNIDGSGQTRLTPDGALAVAPAFSRDGRSIIYSSQDADGTLQLFTMNTDGSGQTQLTTTPGGKSDAHYSPDGRKIVYVSGPDLYIAQTDGSSPVQLTSDAGENYAPSFSQDGAQIAFQTTRNGDYEIYRINADGSNVIPLAESFAGHWFRNPAYSPDGTQIAFDSEVFGSMAICVMNADGSGKRPLTANADYCQEPCWSAGPVIAPYIAGIHPTAGYAGVPVTLTGNSLSGATEVAFNGTPARCFTVDSDAQITAVVPYGATSGPVTVTGPAGAGSSPEAFTVIAPGPGRIAFFSSRDGNFEVYAINPDGTGEERLTDNGASDLYPAISPDSSRIAFATNRDGNPEIYTMNARGGDLVRLTNDPGQDQYPVYSPDGRRIAFSTNRDGNYEIYLMNADGSGQTRLTSNAFEDYSLAFSPDGRKIAFTSNRGGNRDIYLMNADGSGETRLTTDAGYDETPAFSPDGTKIAFQSLRDGNYNIYLMNADGSGQTSLTADAGQDTAPAFSPDGTRIVFTSNRTGHYQLYVMNADGSAQTEITSSAANNGYPSWGSVPVPPQVLTVTPTSGYPGQLVTLTGNCFVGVSGVTFNGTPAVCWTVDSPTQISAVIPYGATTGALRVITLGGSGEIEPFTVLPAGAGKIVYMDERTGDADIYSINPDGSMPARLTRTGDWETDPSLSPDGTRIAFGRFSNIYVMNADGSGETCLTSEGYNYHPRFSPDGRKITFISERTADAGQEHVYVMNADGSGQARVHHLDWGDYFPTFTADGRAIVFSHYDQVASEDRIYRVNLDGSGLTLLHTGMLGYSLDCEPDGHILFYGYAGGSGSAQIFRMNADGSNLTAITDGSASDAYPCVSPDGARIVFASDRAGDWSLYTMNADGSGQTRLTDDPGTEECPYWGGGPAPTALSDVRLAADPDNFPYTGNAQLFTAHPEAGICPEYSFAVTLKDIQADFTHSEVTIEAGTPYALDPDFTFTPADPGRYTVTVTARERGTADPLFTRATTVVIGTNDLRGVSAFTADQPSGIALDAIPAGGITLSAAIDGDGAGVQYFFSGTLRTVAPDGTATNVPVTLSTVWGGNTCAWQPTAAGYYTLRVMAADASYNLHYSAYLTFLVRDPSLTGLTFTASPASGMSIDRLPAGGITLTGTPSGTGVGVQYFFSGARTALADGTAVNEPFALSTAWSTTATCNWTPAAPGTYLLSLTARDASGNTAITKRLTYRVGPPRLTAVGLTADQPSGLLETNVPADGILLTAIPTPASASVEYFFAAKRRVYAPDGTFTDTPVTLSIAYDSSPTGSWRPAAPGVYLLTVSARDTYYGLVAKRTISFVVKPASLTGIAGLTAAPPSGTTDDAIPADGIVLTATPQGSGAGAQYFFSAKLKDVAADGSVTVVPAPISTAWSTDPTCAWMPATPGNYTVTVTAKDADCVVSFTKSLSYLLKTATLTGVTAFTPDIPSGALLGNLPPDGVQVTATIAGTGTGVQYRYQVGKSNGTSYVYEPLTDYTASNVYTFAPATAGVYRLWVFAYDATYNTSYSRYVNYVVK